MNRLVGIATLIASACASSSPSADSSNGVAGDAGEDCSATGEGGVLVDLSGIPADVDARIILEGPGGRIELGTGGSARVAVGRYAILSRGPEPDPRNSRVFYEPILPKYTVCVAPGPANTVVSVTFRRYTLE